MGSAGPLSQHEHHLSSLPLLERLERLRSLCQDAARSSGDVLASDPVLCLACRSKLFLGSRFQ